MYFDETKPLTPPRSDDESELKTPPDQSSSINWALKKTTAVMDSHYVEKDDNKWQAQNPQPGTFHSSLIGAAFHPLLPATHNQSNANNWSPQSTTLLPQPSSFAPRAPSFEPQRIDTYPQETDEGSGALASAFNFAPQRRASGSAAIASSLPTSAPTSEPSSAPMAASTSVSTSAFKSASVPVDETRVLAARGPSPRPVVVIEVDNASKAVRNSPPVSNSSSSSGLSKPVAKLAASTPSTGGTHLSSQREQTTDRVLKRMQTAYDNQMIGEGLRNNVAATIELLNLGLSDKATEARAGDTVAHRKRIIERLSAASNIYLTAFLENRLGRKVLYEWLRDALPAKDGETLKDERATMIHQTLLPMILLYKALPMKVEFLQSETKFGKLVKILSKRTLPSVTIAKLSLTPSQVVLGMLSDWQAMFPGEHASEGVDEPVQSSSAPSDGSTKRKSSPESEDVALPKKRKAGDNLNVKSSTSAMAAQPSVVKDGALKSASKGSGTSAAAKSSSAVKVKADSSFFSSGGSTSGVAVAKKKATTAKSTDAAPSATRKRKPDALDDLLFAPAAKKSPILKSASPVAQQSPSSDAAPVISSTDGKRVKGKMTVRWKPDAELEQIRYIESTQDVDAALHANVAEHGLGILEVQEGELFKRSQSMMDEEIDWYAPQDVSIPPVPMDRAPNPERGRDSEEKKVQEQRESSILIVSYDSPLDIPPSPAEPDYVPTETPEPKKIPVAENIATVEATTSGGTAPITSLEQMGLDPAFLQSLLSRQQAGYQLAGTVPEQEYGVPGPSYQAGPWTAPASAPSSIWGAPVGQSSYPVQGSMSFARPAPLGFTGTVNAAPNTFQPNRARLCRFYSQGRCLKGDNCDFKHE